ncbi:MAG: PAS domain S-box protein, partial [Bacteroidota bacterium]
MAAPKKLDEPRLAERGPPSGSIHEELRVDTASAWTIRVYRLFAVSGGVGLVVYGYLYQAILPTAFDPLGPRFALCGLFLAVFAASWVRAFAERCFVMAVNLTFTLALGWVAWLAYLNDFEANYVLGQVGVSTIGLIGLSIGGRSLWWATLLTLFLAGPFLVLFRWAEATTVSVWVILGNVSLATIVAFFTTVWVRRGQESLRASRALFEAIFQASNDGVVLHSLDGAILEVNQGAVDQLGYTAEELRTMKLKELVPSQGLRPPPGMLERITRDGHAVFESEYLRKDGTTFVAEVSASLFHVKETPYIQGIMRDVTERWKARLERQQHLADLELARRDP